MDLKKVITIRHSLYDRWTPEMGLNDIGKSQTQRLASALKDLINGSKVLLVTSGVNRCRETASFCGEAICAEPVVFDDLNLDNYGDGERQRKGLERILPDDVGVLVVVTHFQAPAGIINAFSKKYCNKSFDCCTLNYGKALMLDITTGEVCVV